jgi:hypothetical protein
MAFLEKKFYLVERINPDKSYSRKAPLFGRKVKKNAENSDHNIGPQTLKCQRNCEKQFENVRLTQANFPAKTTFKNTHYFCLALHKMRKICSDPLKADIFEKSENGGNWDRFYETQLGRKVFEQIF